MTATVARENALHFQDDPVWTAHCLKMAKLLEQMQPSSVRWDSRKDVHDDFLGEDK